MYSFFKSTFFCCGGIGVNLGMVHELLKAHGRRKKFFENLPTKQQAYLMSRNEYLRLHYPYYGSHPMYDRAITDKVNADPAAQKKISQRAVQINYKLTMNPSYYNNEEDESLEELLTCRRQQSRSKL